MMLREMKLSDVDAVLAVEQSVQSYPWSRGNFCDALRNGYQCYLDEFNNTPRAYAIVMPVVDEAELLNIGVAAAQQRQGLGRAMLREILKLARDRQMKRMFLEVRPSNLPAIALYETVGFCEIGRRRGYYQGSEDALIMACELHGI
ncbi:MAG: ribosomal protein S18-alanine N-acetyltransferase [Pseudomonadota bacterium]